MPYAILVSHIGKGTERDWEHIGLTYEDGASAGAYVKAENHYAATRRLTRRYRAIKISADDPLLWREREQRKLDDGIYQKLPWTDYYSSTGMYEHIDPDDPTKVRFIASEEDGLAGRYISMTPGRFVRKYLDSCPPSDLLDVWCAKMGLDKTTSPLLLARTAEEIIRVYTEGPHSCMSYPAGHPNFAVRDIHPVTPYGDSDLAVAYIERYGEITARCLVWPKKKRHGRIYGDEARLLERLRENDYVKNWNFTGARIHSLKSRGLVVPYIDGDDYGLVQVDDDWLVISNQPHIIAKSPTGRALADSCENCGASGVWLHSWWGPDGDYDEPQFQCAEGCKN